MQGRVKGGLTGSDHGIPLHEVRLELSLEGWQRGGEEDISSGEISVNKGLGLRKPLTPRACVCVHVCTSACV